MMTLRNISALSGIWLLIAILFPHGAHASLIGKEAPDWDISEWLNSDPGSLRSLKGKVVVIDFFQMWCPGCNAFSIPLMHHWESVFEKEASESRIVFISIHTVFEGHGHQNPDRLRKYIKRKKITHPVGIDRHANGRRTPQTMLRYNTMGTPEMAIIGKNGRVRFQRFGSFDHIKAEGLIRQLLEEQMEPEKASLSPARLLATRTAR